MTQIANNKAEQKFEVDFAESSSKRAYVYHWLQKLKDKKVPGRIYEAIKALTNEGNNAFDVFPGLSRQSGRRINGILFQEFRYSYKSNEYRIIYVQEGKQFRMVYGFVKKTRRTPEHVFDTAYSRYQAYYSTK